MLDGLLKASGLSVADVDVIGFNGGPGSFTGLRIGMGIVQGLAFGADIPVVGVSTLQSIAQAAIDKIPLAQGQLIMPSMDARMSEIYWGIYRNVGGTALSEHADSISGTTSNDMQSGQQSLADKIAVGVGDGWQYRENISVRPVTIVEELTCNATQVLSLSLYYHERGLSEAVEQLEPVYLRNELTWKKRQRLRNPKN
jgi:tRNA threonylcarbamoyladenosine biosynthesis protein TsaB